MSSLSTNVADDVADRGRPSRPSPATLALMIAFSAIGPLSIDLFLPGVPLIARDLHASPEAATATVSSFFAGLALGQLAMGPLSDRFGRRLTILVGLLLFVVGALAAAWAESIGLLLSARVMQALGASAITVSGRAMVRDLFDEKSTASMISTLAMVAGLAPVLAPSFGALLLAFGSWRLIFGTMALIGLAMLVGATLFLKESRSLEAARLARAAHPLASYGRLLRNSRLMGFLLAAAFNSASFFSYVASAPLLLMEVYHVPRGLFSLIFAVNVAGLIGANQINRMLLRKHTPKRLLAGSALSIALLTVGYVLFAYTLWGGLVVLLPLIFLMIASTCLVQANTMACALSIDPNSAGSIAALFGATSFAAGTAASMMAGILYDGTARWILVVIGFSMIATSASIRFLALRPGAAIAPEPAL